MTTAKNEVFIGPKLENCYLVGREGGERELNFIGEGEWKFGGGVYLGGIGGGFSQKGEWANFRLVGETKPHPPGGKTLQCKKSVES